MAGASIEPFTLFRDQFGFVPAVFRAQAQLPQLIAAEARLLESVVFRTRRLTRVQKECILLLTAAGCRNAYCFALHDQTLQVLGLSEAKVDSIVADGLALSADEETAEEAILASAVGRFLCIMAAGLGVAPDFTPRPIGPAAALNLTTSKRIQTSEVQAFQAALLGKTMFGQGVTEQALAAIASKALAAFLEVLEPKEKLHPSPAETRPPDVGMPADPDSEQVARVKNGDLDAFEHLMQRHSQRVYRTLIAILGDPDEAKDAMQDTFLKAFQHLSSFEGRSKFSTWLLSIAGNTAVQRVRDRKPMESLDESGEDEGFRPRQVRAWTDDPEQLYSKTEMRELIESSVMRLPVKYRVVLMLRDIEQLPAEEAAAALGLGIPALKARLLRGRLMLREALAPHFAGLKGAHS
jgi:RNA polymerase sigma-70 factor (ECF subfamily)